MRPTLLDFRSPKERTGDFTTNAQQTHTGGPVQFPPKSMNKKPVHLP